MRTKHLCLVAVMLLCGNFAAHADTIQQFSVNATGSNYIYVDVPATQDVPEHYAKQLATGTLSVTGTYTIDTTIGAFLGGDVFVNIDGMVTEVNYVRFTNMDAPIVSIPDGYTGGHPAGISLIEGPTVNFPYVGYDLSVPYSLVGYTGGSLCSDTNQEGDCYGQGSGLIYATSYSDVYIRYTDGTLTPVTTPEPSGLALLGTGLLGVGAAIRRKFSSSGRDEHANLVC